MARAFERPHLRDVMVAYGGVRDARHREWLESRRAAGLPGPRDGLAELAKKSRSSMIRGVRQLLGSGQLAMTRGGGRTEGGTGAANMYRLANLPGVELGQLQQLAEDARVQAEPSPDFQRARQRIQEIKEAAFGQTTRGHDPPPG
jgi:hypothetical protein